MSAHHQSVLPVVLAAAFPRYALRSQSFAATNCFRSDVGISRLFWGSNLEATAAPSHVANSRVGVVHLPFHLRGGRPSCFGRDLEFRKLQIGKYLVETGGPGFERRRTSACGPRRQPFDSSGGPLSAMRLVDRYCCRVNLSETQVLRQQGVGSPSFNWRGFRGTGNGSSNAAKET